MQVKCEVIANIVITRGEDAGAYFGTFNPDGSLILSFKLEVPACLIDWDGTDSSIEVDDAINRVKLQFFVNNEELEDPNVKMHFFYAMNFGMSLLENQIAKGGENTGTFKVPVFSEEEYVQFKNSDSVSEYILELNS